MCHVFNASRSGFYAWTLSTECARKKEDKRLETLIKINFNRSRVKKMGHKVKISLMTPHTLITLQTLPGTQLMTNTVIRLAEPFLQPLGLMMRETPYKLRQYRAKLYWHARDQNDQGHGLLRELIKEISTTIS